MTAKPDLAAERTATGGEEPLPDWRAITDMAHVAALENLKNGWAALRMIRGTLEQSSPGILPSEEAVLLLHGPEPVHEATVLVEAIQTITDERDKAIERQHVEVRAYVAAELSVAALRKERDQWRNEALRYKAYADRAEEEMADLAAPAVPAPDKAQEERAREVMTYIGFLIYVDGMKKTAETFIQGTARIAAALSTAHASGREEGERASAARIEELETGLRQALGIIVEFGDLNGFRNLSDEELGRAVLEGAKRFAALLSIPFPSQERGK